MSEAMTLAGIADLDMNEVEEVRFEALPNCLAKFTIEKVEMDEGENGDGDPYVAIMVNCKVVECMQVLDKKWEGDPESLEGKGYTERFYIPMADPEKRTKGLGRFKAFFVDTGAEPEDSTVQALMEALVETEFVATVGVRKNKDNPDQVFNSLSKVGPAE